MTTERCEIFENLEGVLKVVRKACLSDSSPSPGPSRQGRVDSLATAEMTGVI